MSKDKYLCTFSCQMDTTGFVFNILQTFFTACTVGEYHLDVASLSWVIFSHLMCLDQSHERNYLMNYKNQ